MANYTVNKMHQAGWLVYINGLEIPVARVDVDFGVWKKPSLTLQMVPHQLLQRIGSEDRLQVVVFYLDLYWEPDSPTFRLLGEFEVVGWGYNNTPNGRFVQLNCISQLQIFDQLHFYYIASMDDIATACGGTAGSDTSGANVVKTIYPAALFLEGLTAPNTVESSVKDFSDIPLEIEAGNNLIKTPLEFVVNIFRSLLRPVSGDSNLTTETSSNSETIPRSAASVPGKNFFARWMNMTRFHRRWVALPVLEDNRTDECFPLLKAAQDTQTLLALQNQIGQSVGNAGSAWELLQKVYGYMYMEVGVLPAPPAAIVDTKTGYIELPHVSGGINSPGKGSAITTYFVKPQCIFAMPPACNVIFPSMMERYSVNESYINQPTRLYLSEGFITNVLTQASTAAMSSIAQDAMTTGYPPVVKKRMSDLRDSPQSNNKNMLIFPEEFFKGPVTKRLNAPPWMYMLSQQNNANPGQAVPTDNAVKGYSSIPAPDSSGISSDGPLNVLFDTYAEYEFYRSRFAERSGGVSLAWNPYIVPGFPAMVFDERSEGFDSMAYVNNVKHTLFAGQGPQMSTSVGLTFIRTLPEFLGILHTGLEEETSTYLPDVSPPEIIPDVRDAFQYADTARDLYKRLFYSGDSGQNETVFNWKDIVDVKNGEGNIIDPTYEQWKINKYVKITPKPQYDSLFKSHDAAMHFVSRPACSLRDYVEIWHGRAFSELKRDGIVAGEHRSFYSVASDKLKTEGAVFWSRIYKLIQGPGDNPGVGVTNIGDAPEYAAAGEGMVRFVGPGTGMAQTREDWDAILEEYRKIVRSAEGKIAPQD